jgi:phytanoyl-CoA hydroxylase
MSRPTAKAGFVEWTPQGISDADVAFYRENGFLVVENAIDADEVKLLNDDALAICRGKYGEYNGWVGPHDGQTDEDVLAQYLCIHFPHKFSPTMHEYLASTAMKDVLSKVVGPNVKCMQSMLFIKAAGKPGQAWHQDEFYIPTRDRSLTGGWIALDDATVENGCLWVIPGSHKRGILWPQHKHDDRRFDCSGESYQFPYTEEDEIPVEVPAGSIVFFNGYLLHRSLPNKAKSGYRRVLVNHYMSAESLLPWMDHKGVAPGQADFRDIVMICGEDPYAWKGIEDRVKPHVRPSGEGGCGGWGDKNPARKKAAENA